jgi:hypothetical protein
MTIHILSFKVVFSSAVPVKKPLAQKQPPKKAPIVQIKQQSSSEESSSEEDEPKTKVAKAAFKTPVKTPAKPTVQVKQDDSSSPDSDDSKCDRFSSK